jgi:hypothetical protein
MLTFKVTVKRCRIKMFCMLACIEPILFTITGNRIDQIFVSRDIAVDGYVTVTQISNEKDSTSTVILIFQVAKCQCTETDGLRRESVPV